MNILAPNLIFDHVGLVVRDIVRGEEALGKLLPVAAWTKQFDDVQLGVSVKFSRDASGIVYELIAPLGENSPVAKTALSRIGVINQLAYRVPDISAGLLHMRNAGATPTGPAKPAVAFGGALVQFFLTPLGFIIELIEVSAFSHEFIQNSQ